MLVYDLISQEAQKQAHKYPDTCICMQHQARIIAEAL